MGALIGGAFRAAVWCCSLLSLGGQRRLARWLGWAAWRLNTTDARVTRTNVALCFPELSAAEADALARRSLQNTAALLTESGVVFHWRRERWLPLVRRVQGEFLIRDAIRSGAGVLLLAPHLGNWEFLSLYLGRYRFLALYDPPRQRALEAPILRSRRRSGARFQPIAAAGIRSLYGVLRRHGVAALLPDQVPERQAGVYARFFGHPALTMTFAHRLIRATRPRVLLCAALRTPGGFDVRIVEAETGVYDPDPAVSARAMNAGIEALVRADPAQYQWEYKRFKRQPPGHPGVYR